MKVRYLKTTPKGMHLHEILAATAAEKTALKKNPYHPFTKGTDDHIWSENVLSSQREMEIDKSGNVFDPMVKQSDAEKVEELAGTNLRFTELEKLVKLRQIAAIAAMK